MRSLTVLTTAALAACTAANSPEACRITKIAELPIHMVGTLPLVELRINDHPARLVLDTGAEQTLVREGALERLGLERNYQSAIYVTGFGAQTANYASRPATVAIGPITLPPAPLMVSNAPLRLAGGETLDGLLGSEVLSGYDVDIDIAQGRVGLYERRRCSDGPPPFPGPANTVHAEGDRAFKLTVPVTIGAVAMMAELDTGAGRSFVDAEAAGLTEADLAADRSSRLSTVDPVGLAVRLHRFSQLRVGSETVANPLLSVGRLQDRGYSALLGSDFWRTRRVWISYGSRTVTIGPIQPRPR